MLQEKLTKIDVHLIFAVSRLRLRERRKIRDDALMFCKLYKKPRPCELILFSPRPVDRE